MKDNYVKARPKNYSMHILKNNVNGNQHNINSSNQIKNVSINNCKDFLDVKRNITDKSSIRSINTNIEIMTNQSNSSYTNNTVKSSNTTISTSLADNLNSKVLNQNHNIITNNMERSPNCIKNTVIICLKSK